ncbi:MAG: CusA/CzcA family heavy metal efflux RND transporter [Marinilabiliales bacterium]|nr:CusA/CzcA family heavy metal efflux RND transporter [Marinilabiliales bacterium]
MIERIIHFSIRQKLLVGLFVLGLVGWGIYSLSKLPVDAIPDITNNQVQIISLAPSLAVQEVESFVTAPVEVAVANIPDIIELRSISRLGLSVITVVFKDEVDLYWARQQLNERIQEASESIPPGLARIELAPVSSGLGEIFQYRLAVDKGLENKYNPMELRTLQDWVVRREMLGTPGVADVNSYGGFVKQYEIAVNPERLRGMNLTLNDIFVALEKNNENTGSAYIDKKPNAYFIRGIGLVRNIDDIGKIVVKSSTSGIPVLIRDIASVQYGHATRYGAFVVDTTEAVGGVVMMLKGANAHQVIDRVTERIATIQKSLPNGVHIEPFLNRSDLVGRAIRTVSGNLMEGALIVIFILVLLLGNFRAGLLVASVIPLSMLFAISMMNLFGVSGNLMSLGAIDFGLIVDGAVIIVEGVVHSMAKVSLRQGEQALSQDQMDRTVFESAKRMMSSATFGQIIILIVYLPVLALTGIEGKMFRPMAQVVMFALAGATILSLTYVPMVSSMWLSRKRQASFAFSERIIERMFQLFQPILQFSLRRKALVSLSALLLFAGSLFIFNSLGGEFIPQLEEGDLAAGVMTLQGGSLSHTIETVEKANKILLSTFPEIKHAVCKIGAGEIPTDPTPMETGDYIITLKDKKEWTSASTREELVEKMETALVPLAGVKFEFQQPIQMRFNELLSGSRQDIAVKIFGDNLDVLASKAEEVAGVIRNVEGVSDLNVEKVTGLAQVQVDYNRDRLAQYGLSVGDANRALRTAFAGSQAGGVYDEEKRFALIVRLDKDFRQNTEDVANLSLPLPDGGQIPFGMVADISVRSGPAQVSREDTKRRITVGFNVRGRDIQNVIEEVTARIDRKVKLPTGYYLSYGGQFKNLEAARGRLLVAVPVALLLILVLLYFTFHSLKQSLLIFLAVPFSAMGGILALWLRDMNFSISAGVGFIALFGVAVLNGIVLIAEFNRLESNGLKDINERILTGLKSRFRPVIMTAAVASLGFLPMALSTSAGAEVQKPLATVVIGGLISATLLTLVILPVCYALLHSLRKSSNTETMKGSMPVILLLLTLVAFAPATSRAQSVRKINLKEAINLALDSNLTIRAASYAADVQRSLKGAAWDLPKLNLEGQYGRFNSYTRDNSFTVSQSFAFPTLYLQQNRLAGARVKSSEFDKATVRLEVATRVKQLYWQMAYLSSRKHLLQFQDSLYSGFSRAATLRAQSGETNRLEMVTARSQSMEVRNQLQQTLADIQLAKSALQLLLNSHDPVMPVDTLLHRMEGGILTDTLSIADNPQLAKVQQQTEIARLEKRVEYNKMLPELSLGYFSQTMQGVQEVNGMPRTFGAGDRLDGLQAGVTIPLWFTPYAAKAKAARLHEMEARAEEEGFQKNLRGNLKMLKEELAKYRTVVDYYEGQAIHEADLIIDQSGRSYKAGAMDYLDYVLSLGRALSIRESYLDALNNYNQTVIEIERMMGKI